jgi:hypothetical protein
MIPTRLKAKLPRHLSYPIGAGAISEALAGAPHVEAFTVMFWDAAVWPASEFRRRLSERLPYVVMGASYSPASGPGLVGSDRMVQDGWYEEKWELRVNPVLPEFRHPANRLLREEGLPAIVRWLKSSGRAGWTATWHRIDLVFDPAEGSLASQECSGV